jgi:hypothetical protein
MAKATAKRDTLRPEDVFTPAAPVQEDMFANRRHEHIRSSGSYGRRPIPSRNRGRRLIAQEVEGKGVKFANPTLYPRSQRGVVGWPTGLEPVTFGATIRCSAS